MLLFPITDKYEEFAREQEAAMKDKTVSDKLYYMKQTISNACGTVALMHSVINNVNGDVIKLNDGPLKKFIEATKEMTPEERAVKLEGDDDICNSHDAAAREGQTQAPDRDEKGGLYELDGRKSGPIYKDKCSSDTFLTQASAAWVK